MNQPKVSVIVPVYNGAAFIGETIRSVLDQTYENFELIVIDDVSTDNSSNEVQKFVDPRLLYITHDSNQGAKKARLSGIQASSGEILFFLDQDDLFHPQKIELHVRHIESHPESGITYNPHYSFISVNSSKEILGIWRQPSPLKLSDLVLGFPISPSEMVLTSKWATQNQIWGDVNTCAGGEIVLAGRLWFEGCKFGLIEKVLNYRRYHPGRVISNLVQRCEDELKAQETIFEDPRCPQDVRALRSKAFTNTFLEYACYSFAQSENELGEKYIQSALNLSPSLLDGDPCGLTKFLAIRGVEVSSNDHESFLVNAFHSLPLEGDLQPGKYQWALARGYVLKGVQAKFWGRLEQSEAYLSEAKALGAQVDEEFLRSLVDQILIYESEVGLEAAEKVLQEIVQFINDIGDRKAARFLVGCLSVNRGFQKYRENKFPEAFLEITHAVINDPGYLLDRGVLSVLFHSVVRGVSMRGRGYPI